MTQPAHAQTTTRWNRAYEIKAVTLLSLGSGLVGLDRFIINPLFPVISADLGLNYQDLGLISAALALSWGLASIFAGGLSDRVGRKRVLVPAVLIFSLLVATSGLATGLISLLVIRSLMGLAEGGFVPAGIVTTIEASKPTRAGLNVGLQQMASPLVGLGLGPLIAVGLLAILPSWHWVFAAIAVPGLLVAWLMQRHLRDDSPRAQANADKPLATAISDHHAHQGWRTVLRYRAVYVNTLCMICWLSCLVVLSAFMPNYLTDHLKLELESMGMVLAGLGFGSFTGMVALPALADRLGGKNVLLLATLLVLPLLWLLPQIGAEPMQLFGLLFLIMFMISGAVTITLGPLTGRAVPPALATTAMGIVVGLGEIVGGAITPALTGALAHRFGIPIVIDVALGAVALGFIIVLLGVRMPRQTQLSSHAPTVN